METTGGEVNRHRVRRLSLLNEFVREHGQREMSNLRSAK